MMKQVVRGTTLFLHLLVFGSSQLAVGGRKSCCVRLCAARFILKIPPLCLYCF